MDKVGGIDRGGDGERETKRKREEKRDRERERKIRDIWRDIDY